MNKKVLAVDIDDVIFPFVPELAKYHNQNFNTEYDIDSFHTYIFNEVWGGSTEEGHAKIMNFFTSDFRNVEPIKGSYDALLNIKDRYDLYIVTSRDEELRPITEPWINARFPGVFKNLILCGNPYTGNGYRTKSQICRDIEAEYLIDDQIKYCQEFSNEGIASILFGAYKWNQGYTPQLTTRAQHWEDVLRIIYG